MKLEKITQWTAEAESGLSETFGHDRDGIIAGVQQGLLELWRVHDGAAWMVTRCERGVLTICCLQGKGLAALAPLIYRIAQKNGLQWIEFATSRPALARLLQKWRFRVLEAETIFRCEVIRDGRPE